MPISQRGAETRVGSRTQKMSRSILQARGGTSGLPSGRTMSFEEWPKDLLADTRDLELLSVRLTTPMMRSGRSASYRQDHRSSLAQAPLSDSYC